jgi:raffinose/stachyose/melibiose transport system permease protein
MASINYKQYQAGFYGISTAGNVILLVFVSALVIPLTRFLNRKELDN